MSREGKYEVAILTPGKPPQPAHRPRKRQEPSLSDQASSWLNHPIADLALVIASVAMLLSIGTLMVWSASTVFGHRQFGDAFYFLKRQSVWVLFSVIACWVASRIPLYDLRRLGWVVFGVAGLLLALTFTPLGYGVGGNKNWLNLGGENSMLRLQPSEFAKLALIVWGAAILTNKRNLLDKPQHLLIPFLPASALMIGLVLMQHDLGTAIILGMLVLAVLWVVGAPFRVLGGLFALVAVAAPIMIMGNDSRIARIGGFLDPTRDPTGVNQQPMRALYGLATGGWFGVGLGASRQKWGSLSEAHTDYVLAIIGEELGLLGTLCVVVLFAALGYAGIRIALRTATFYGRLVAAGITCWFMLQALINIMVVLRLLPVLGVPLPFVSYGGSALLANLISIGVLLACAADEPEAKHWLNSRRRKTPRIRLSAVLPGKH